MAITKVWMEEGCTSCGLCAETCPQVFKMEDIAVVIEGVNYSDYEGKVKEAADDCPVGIINYE